MYTQREAHSPWVSDAPTETEWTEKSELLMNASKYENLDSEVALTSRILARSNEKS